MPKKFAKKDKFQDLDEGFKSGVQSMKIQEINNKIAEWAKLVEAQGAAMKADEDLAQKRETAKLAAEPYREDIKTAKLRIAYAMQVLGDRGTE
jgi:hypothetical protein